MDGNFKAEHLHPIKPYDEVWLFDGLGFMVGKERYQKHLEEAADTGKIELQQSSGCQSSKCSSAQAGVHRQMNMDYTLCEAAQHNMDGITRAVTFYDINCQYNKHLHVQVDRGQFLTMIPELTIIPGIGLWHIHGHQDSCYMNNSNFCKMICMKRTLCQKYKQAKNGIAKSGKAFDRLDEAAPANLKTGWLASERIAQSNRIQDPAAMDIYEINIKKGEITLSQSKSEFILNPASSKKEIELRLLQEGNACHAAPSHRSVATWISMGLAIEEAQIALLIEVRRIGKRTTETQRLDITRQRDRLQGQIDAFTRIAVTHLGEGFDADDNPDDLNVDILDDLDDDPEDFIRTSDTWTNSPELTVIPLPSNLRVDRCKHCMAEDLILLELSLREGQVNDALHNLKIHLCNKAILFRTTVRQAKSQALKIQAWSQVMSVQQAVSLHASIYTKTRKQMIKLELGQDQLQKYKPLLREQLKVSMAVGDPNAQGQRNESLAWFWSIKADLGVRITHGMRN
ncbi:uncharacterized protein EDB91DRAFT_1087858, partial [Suillus paluster]|uniref:uncharacterized protein n=1 Tax=Suillus paluster TaxID=48578 RepID=UPI001B867101